MPGPASAPFLCFGAGGIGKDTEGVEPPLHGFHGRGIDRAWEEAGCAEYIMRNARLDEAKAGIKNAGRNINKLGWGVHLRELKACHSAGVEG